MPVTIHPLCTGFVRIRPAQVARKPLGPLRVLDDASWSEWLPIHAWLIDHPEGPILVDTGQSCAACRPGYFPAWHPYYRRAAEFDVRSEQEVGPALGRLGLRPADVRIIVLTHLHTDHAGGLHHFPQSRILVSEREWRDARGVAGKLRGYLPHRWPTGLVFQRITLPATPAGYFDGTLPLTKSADVLIVATPGHTLGHVSVLVRTEGLSYFLAGDASYTERTLLARIPDGVTFSPKIAVRTLNQVLAYAETEKTVYLPAHDPESERRLRERATVAVPIGWQRGPDRDCLGGTGAGS